MFRKLVLSSCKLFILILVCNFFLKGQGLKSGLNVPFQNCWELPEGLNAQIASDNVNKIFIPLSTGIIKTLDINKKEVWKADLGGEIITPPIYHNKTLYVISKANIVSPEHSKKVGDPEYSVSAIDTDSGVSKWKKVYKSEKRPLLTFQRDRLIIISNGETDKSSSDFNVLDKNTGRIIFEKKHVLEVKELFNAPDENSENIVMLTSLDSIASFSILDGRITFLYTSLKDIRTGATSDKGIFISNNRGLVYYITPTGEENKFKIRFGAGITSITYQRDSILISSLDNFVYSVSLDGRQIIWRRRFPGRIIEKPVIIPDAVIVYSQGDNSLYFLNHDDGKMFNRVTVADEEEIIGSPVFLDSFVIVSTSKGIRVFSLGKCRGFAAAER